MEQHLFEGTPGQLAQHLKRLPDAQTYRMTLTAETGDDDAVESLDSILLRMSNRSPEQVLAARESILAASTQPRDLPAGKTLYEVIMGTWPGTETDEQILEALDRLS